MNALSKVRVLIVDDSIELAGTYQGLLSALGFTVQVAYDGKQAIEAFTKTEFDIVLTDIRMPVMDGVELLKKIRETRRRSPCVLVTSGYTDYPPDVLFHLGANGFLPKPVNAATIREVINKTFLKIEDQWKNSAGLIPTESYSKRFKSLEEMLSSGEIRFGSGGFCIHQNNPSAALHSIINFNISFQETDLVTRIEGIGKVQWLHVVESPNRQKGIGVEIKYLADASRDRLCSWIGEQDFTSYIPMH